MSISGKDAEFAQEILGLFELRRRQVISALACGFLAGVFVIEVLRVSKVLREPIGYAVLAGILAALGLLLLLFTELRIRKTLRHLLEDGTTHWKD